MSITNFFDWFIPQHARNDIEQYRRAYMIVGVSWYGLPFFIVNIVKWANLGSVTLAVSLTIVMILVWMMSFVLRYTGSVALAANGILAGLYWHFIFLPYQTGGMDSKSMSWTLVIPLFAIMLTGSRNAIFWISVTATAIFGFYWLKVTGYQCPTVSLTPEGFLKEQITNAIGPFLATFILGLLLKQGMRQAVKEQQEGLQAQKKAQDFEMLFGQVHQAGMQVTSSAVELAATARQQETTITHQMEFMNTVVTAVEEISGVAVDLVQTMQQVSAMSQETAGFASSSQQDLIRMEDAMYRMEEASKSISGRLETINEKAENITTVVTTITKVADQTNLLSLNAAIEAEKAGEYGRGFTVVAREIRRLADQTAVATLDIEQMVQEMQSAVSSGVMEMDRFIGEVRHNVEDVAKISLQLTKIIEQVQALSPNFEDVKVAMAHQSEHAQEINQAITSLNDQMQQTKNSLHETYSAIEQLNEAARDLEGEVSRFKVNERIDDMAVTHQSL